MFKPPKTEYYSRLITENSMYLYYVHSSGYAYKINKATKQEIKVTPYIRRRCTHVKIDGKEYRLAILIASLFISRVYDHKKHVIRYADKDITNCDANNLILYSKKEIGIITGRLAHLNKPVIIKEYRQEPKEYSSVRAAAKALYCSYQCLLDYLDGKHKTSILKKYGRKIYYKETLYA